MPFTYLYNAVASALRSVGDSRTPVRFLAMASVLNGCLDLVFVAGFGMGVVGAALATDIAEAVSAVLCVVYVYRKVPLLQLKREDIRMDRELLKLTLKHGSITALQQSCQPIGKLLIQGAINPLGVSTIAAFNAVNRVDDFAFTPEQSISSGMMTFIAQNRGAGKKERVKKGFRYGLLVEAGYWVIICTAILLLKEPLMRLFVSEGDTKMVAPGVFEPDGILLSDAGIYQRNPGVFQGNGEYVDYAGLHADPDHLPCCLRISSGAADGNDRGRLGLSDWLEFHAHGGSSVLLLV